MVVSGGSGACDRRGFPPTHVAPSLDCLKKSPVRSRKAKLTARGRSHVGQGGLYGLEDKTIGERLTVEERL